MNPSSTLQIQQAPLASVIVPIFNRAHLLDEVLPSLEEMRDSPYEFIFVDDASTDNLKEKLAQWPVKLIKNDINKGPAFCRNLAVQLASTDFLIFVDSDVKIKMHNIAVMVEQLKADPTRAYIAVYDPQRSYARSMSHYENLYMSFNYLEAGEDFHIFFSSMAGINRSVFSAVGGFDEAYRTSSVEDMELGHRLVKQGVKIRILKQIRLEHLKEYTLWEMLKNNFKKCEGSIKIVLRHKDKLCVGAPPKSYLLSIVISLVLVVSLLFTLLTPFNSFVILLVFYFLNFQLLAFIWKNSTLKDWCLSLIFLFLNTFFQGLGLLAGPIKYLAFKQRY